MRPEYDYGDAVRVLRNVRNDGTYPGLDRGSLLVKRGSVGYVQNVGTFLQDQVIYSVHFMDVDRIIGCRAAELQSENDPWVPSRFEFHDRVVAALPLGKQGQVVVEQGAEGEIEKVLRDSPDGVFYHVRFSGRTLQVPESAIEAACLNEPETADRIQGQV